jgi:hypothetical protein
MLADGASEQSDPNQIFSHSANERAMAGWIPISEIPSDCPLWLCIIEDGRERSLPFPRRWTGNEWVHAVTNTVVLFRPTHWQKWPHRFEIENQGRLRAIQLLLGAELAELYEVFLQQPVPPGIARLLDKLAQRELDELR